MNIFGLSPEQVAARVRSAGGGASFPSLGQSLWQGAAGFSLASLIVFATVAFGERLMYRQFGLPGAYAIWTALFIAAGGAAMLPLIIGPGRTPRFYALFALSFFLYAAGWMAAYFSLRNATGEWLGALAGSVLLGLTLAWAFGAARRWPQILIGLFAGNAAGYFLGSLLHHAIKGRIGMLLWGVSYGLGFGAGLGYALYQAQAPIRHRLVTATGAINPD